MDKAVLQRPLEPGQYVAIRYTERLGEMGAVASVGSKGDSYDNALAETINGLYKTEVIYRRRGGWKGIDDVSFSTLEWVDWFNHRGLLEPIGEVPPADFEAPYDAKEGTEETDGLRVRENPSRAVHPHPWRAVIGDIESTRVRRCPPTSTGLAVRLAVNPGPLAEGFTRPSEPELT